MAEGQVVRKWGGVRAHATQRNENRQSGQDQFVTGKGRKRRKSAVWPARDFLLTWGVNGYLSGLPNFALNKGAVHEQAVSSFPVRGIMEQSSPGRADRAARGMFGPVRNVVGALDLAGRLF